MAKRFAQDNPQIKVETLTLDDGRRAERHTTVDDGGNETIEIFSEEKRPLKLEKRITREMKQVVAKETHETIQDGEVAYQEVRSMEPDAPLQVRARIGIAEHPKLIDGDYVRKEEVGRLITDGVVAGVSALLEQFETVSSQNTKPEKPVFRAQEIIEKNVEEKKSDTTVTIIMAVIVLAQLAFFAYWFLA